MRNPQSISFLLCVAIFLCGAFLGGCKKSISSLVHGPVTHASGDFSSYAVSFASPIEQSAFEKQVQLWCKEKGYTHATAAELQTILHLDQPGTYAMAEVKYPDPANPGCSMLITYRNTGENEGLFGVQLTRDGSDQALERQREILEAQRDEFVKKFEILSRIN